MPRLGAIGHRADAVGAAQFARQRHRRRCLVHDEAGIARLQRGLEPRLRRPRGIFRKDRRLRQRAHPLHHLARVAIGQGAVFPRHLGIARQDVHRRPALDHVRLHRGVRRVEARIGIGAQLVPDVIEQLDELARHHHRIGAFLRRARMAFAAVAMGVQHRARFVRADHLHQRRLADDGQRRADVRRFKIVQQARHAGAADFLVIGQREMDRPRQSGARDLRQQRQRHRNEPLHVAGAAAVEFVAADLRPERIGRPFLAVHRHDVGMARQHIAAWRFRPEAREQIGLDAAGIEGAAAAPARRLQHVLHEIDQREVGTAARGIEPDEALRQRDAV